MTNFYNVTFIVNGKFETYTISAVCDMMAYNEISPIAARIRERAKVGNFHFVEITKA